MPTKIFGANKPLIDTALTRALVVTLAGDNRYLIARAEPDGSDWTERYMGLDAETAIAVAQASVRSAWQARLLAHDPASKWPAPSERELERMLEVWEVRRMYGDDMGPGQPHRIIILPAVLAWKEEFSETAKKPKRKAAKKATKKRAVKKAAKKTAKRKYTRRAKPELEAVPPISPEEAEAARERTEEALESNRTMTLKDLDRFNKRSE